jgi:hypothetical protein
MPMRIDLSSGIMDFPTQFAAFFARHAWRSLGISGACSIGFPHPVQPFFRRQWRWRRYRLELRRCRWDMARLGGNETRTEQATDQQTGRKQRQE